MKPGEDDEHAGTAYQGGYVGLNTPVTSRHADRRTGILVKLPPVEGLSDDERVLLGEALRALRTQRGKAWNAACDAAEAAGKRRPSLRPYGIDEITRLARRLGVGSTHWAE